MNTSGKDSPRATEPAGFIRRRPVAALIIALVLAEALAVAVALRLGLFEDFFPELIEAFAMLDSLYAGK